MILGLGLWELVLLGGLLVALFGLGSVPVLAHRLGWLHGTLQRWQRRLDRKSVV